MVQISQKKYLSSSFHLLPSKLHVSGWWKRHKGKKFWLLLWKILTGGEECVNKELGNRIDTSLEWGKKQKMMGISNNELLILLRVPSEVGVGGGESKVWFL